MQKFFLTTILLMACLYMSAQKVTSYSTTQEQSWKKAQTALSGKARGKVVADVKEQSKGYLWLLAQPSMSITTGTSS